MASLLILDSFHRILTHKIIKFHFIMTKRTYYSVADVMYRKCSQSVFLKFFETNIFRKLKVITIFIENSSSENSWVVLFTGNLKLRVASVTKNADSVDDTVMFEAKLSQHAMTSNSII